MTADEGDGDEWPAIRDQILDADLFVLATPIWIGHLSSIAQRGLERLDAFLGEKDDHGPDARPSTVAIVAVVGNEDGAHHVARRGVPGPERRRLHDPAEAMTYWVGEAMHTTDLKDLPEMPEKTADATRNMVINAVHLARVLNRQPYPSLA